MSNAASGSKASPVRPTMPKQRKRRGLRKVIFLPDKALSLLVRAGVTLPEGEPETVYGYLDKAGQPRRVVARFAHGWRADLRICPDGRFTLRQSSNIRPEAS
ncbi:hypothetical protein ACFOKF_15415 [Sphingobium rhizovicinum]|uniref:Uncharacterized protein n=1 Tax=Sphingobium rhizovicinum TaxID=432308 RepID=A0ABV7NGE8_9SPHN